MHKIEYFSQTKLVQFGAIFFKTKLEIPNPKMFPQLCLGVKKHSKKGKGLLGGKRGGWQRVEREIQILLGSSTVVITSNCPFWFDSLCECIHFIS